MLEDINPAYCGECDTTLSEEYCLPDPDRLPCPVCGATERRFEVSVHAKATILETLNMLGVRAGKSKTKGWFIRTRTATVRQHNRGDELALHERAFDRENDRYFEKVTMLDTGEIVHYCDEPLSEHCGHGADKNSRERSTK